MSQDLLLKKIATIRTDFPEKFGVPRQSGLADTMGKIVFEPEFRNPDALRGIEEYTHLWLLWGFSEVNQDSWHATVRPPRLGGNKRVGVFATRSPFRPNPIGLSCVKLICVKNTETEGNVLIVNGIDMMDGTPIYDIKPYLPYVDSKENASGSFSDIHKGDRLEVFFEKDIDANHLEENQLVQKSEHDECTNMNLIDLSVSEKNLASLENRVPKDKQKALRQILSQDPRPSYQDDPTRIYGMDFAGLEIKFRVEKNVLIVCDVIARS